MVARIVDGREPPGRPAPVAAKAWAAVQLRFGTHAYLQRSTHPKERTSIGEPTKVHVALTDGATE
eukprot:COSAG04_NODE_730_length_10737_cov_31.931002_12_plen_65_part_00